MSTLRRNAPLEPRPMRDAVPRRLLVTTSVVTFAIRNWSLWVLLRDGPWGPPMRLVLGNETVTDAVERILDAVLLWAEDASLTQLKAGWQEQQVQVWGSKEQGAAVSLIHSILLRANRDELRPHLDKQPVPSLRVKWIPVAEIESGAYKLDDDVRPGVHNALYMLRSYIQREPELVLRYLADMDTMCTPATGPDWWQPEKEGPHAVRNTLPLNVLNAPPSGDGILTLAEATLLYRAFFSPDEQIDLSNLRRRLLATQTLQPVDEERPVRGRELDWRRVSRAYRYVGGR